jgi:hypothetical protein
MYRKLRPAASVLAASGTAVALTLAAAATATAATAPGASAAVCATSFPIVVDGFAFAPSSVPPGGSATADLITTNCSALAVATTEMWTGQWLPLDATGAPPAGCPVIDPLLRAVDYTPGEEVAVNATYTVPVGCRAAELVVTVRITTASGASATTSAVLRIDQPIQAG